MIELERDNYDKVKEFADINTCDKVYPFSILEGRQVGQVFVDSLASIKSVLDKDILSKLEGRIIPAYSWNSSEDFLEKGKGYCILHGNEIVTVAFTAAISDTEVDIGIETNIKYRKQGFGKCVASRMVKDILKMNKTPIWECNTNNLGSKAIAESVGFEVLETHPLFMKKII